MHKRNDIFWFTFFHEAGHILLHGKKELFLEINDFQNDKNRENEADNFANKWTLSEEEEREITQYSSLTEKDIIRFAAKFNTHPAIIIGRLQHKKMIPYSAGNRFVKSVLFEV